MSSQVDLHGDELIAKRRLAAEPSRVWEAFTTPSDVAAFWGGSHARVAPDSVAIDLREGGFFTVTTRGIDGATRRLEFTYVHLSEPDELVFDEAVTGLRTTVRIAADSGGTLLTVHQRRLPVELRTEQAANGLASILDALAVHLRTAESTDRR